MRKSRFRFLVSPTTTLRVDVEPMLKLAEATDSALRNRSRMNLDAVVVFPIITDPTIFSQADFLVHKRASNAFYVGRNIDFTTWKRARRSRRLRLALENLRTSVEAVPERHLPSEQKAEILVRLNRAAQRLAAAA